MSKLLGHFRTVEIEASAGREVGSAREREMEK